MNILDLKRNSKLSHLLKVSIVGTSGSGKTTFLKSLFGDFFVVSDVERKQSLEKKANLTYTPLDPNEVSTTTVSLNQLGAMVLFTKSNQLEIHEISKGVDNLLERDNIDYFMTFSIFDTAGQERFEFMADICMKGSDAIILFADGTNVSSIEYLNNYIEKIRKEEERTDKKIPAIVFLNKSDLSEKGQYLGADFARTAIRNEYEVFETTVTDPECFKLPLRVLVNKIRESR
ncbi:MAG: GTP-binding protein [Asgard group archaeon]|nr:GTP-binding protein [Asgard group archaeon]